MAPLVKLDGEINDRDDICDVRSKGYISTRIVDIKALEIDGTLLTPNTLHDCTVRSIPVWYRTSGRPDTDENSFIKVMSSVKLSIYRDKGLTASYSICLIVRNRIVDPHLNIKRHIFYM
jgi:hypothetical protein